jgi:CRP-like cAMP-binding protein
MLGDDRIVGSVERVFHLKKAPITGTLPPHLLAALADATRPRVFRQGELLLREGERVAANYFVVEGRLLLSRGGRAIDRAEPGAAIGALGILAHAPAPISASAEVDTLTLELDADTCFDLLEDHFGILRHFLREITARIVEGWRRVPPGTPPALPRIVPRAVPSATRDLDLVERMFFLRQVAPFGQSSINALAELARALHEVHFEPGARLWHEGEDARHVVLVVAGRVECAGRDGFLLHAGPGTPLGALEAMAGVPRWYSADVTAPVTGLSAEIEVLFDVLEDNPDMALSQLRTMSEWLLALTQQLAEQALAEQALAEPAPASG